MREHRVEGERQVCDLSRAGVLADQLEELTVRPEVRPQVGLRGLLECSLLLKRLCGRYSSLLNGHDQRYESDDGRGDGDDCGGVHGATLGRHSARRGRATRIATGSGKRLYPRLTGSLPAVSG